MEINSTYSDRHNKALDLYRHEEEERMKRFCDAYDKWANMPEGTIWWFKARSEAWEEYLKAREAWTGY